MMISNEELVASNPLYQHLIDNDPDSYYPWTENLETIAEEERVRRRNELEKDDFSICDLSIVPQTLGLLSRVLG